MGKERVTFVHVCYRNRIEHWARRARERHIERYGSYYVESFWAGLAVHTQYNKELPHESSRSKKRDDCMRPL